MTKRQRFLAGEKFSINGKGFGVFQFNADKGAIYVCHKLGNVAWECNPTLSGGFFLCIKYFMAESIAVTVPFDDLDFVNLKY